MSPLSTALATSTVHLWEVAARLLDAGRLDTVDMGGDQAGAGAAGAPVVGDTADDGAARDTGGAVPAVAAGVVSDVGGGAVPAAARCRVVGGGIAGDPVTRDRVAADSVVRGPFVTGGRVVDGRPVVGGAVVGGAVVSGVVVRGGAVVEDRWGDVVDRSESW